MFANRSETNTHDEYQEQASNASDCADLDTEGQPPSIWTKTYMIFWDSTRSGAHPLWTDAQLREFAKEVNRSGFVIIPLKSSPEHNFKVGDRFFFLRHGDKGDSVIGYGFVVTIPDGSLGEERESVEILVEALVDPLSKLVFASSNELRRLTGTDTLWNEQFSLLEAPDSYSFELQELILGRELIGEDANPGTLLTAEQSLRAEVSRKLSREEVESSVEQTPSQRRRAEIRRQLSSPEVQSKLRLRQLRESGEAAIGVFGLVKRVLIGFAYIVGGIVVFAWYQSTTPSVNSRVSFSERLTTTEAASVCKDHVVRSARSPTSVRFPAGGTELISSTSNASTVSVRFSAKNALGVDLAGRAVCTVTSTGQLIDVRISGG